MFAYRKRTRPTWNAMICLFAAFIGGVFVTQVFFTSPSNCKTIASPSKTDDLEVTRVQSAVCPSCAMSVVDSGSAGWKTIDLFVGTNYSPLPAGPEWHSQESWQDRTIAHIFGRSGYFVDLASHDAQIGSNTLSLERDYGWNGVCIEANSRFFWGLAYRKAKIIGAVATKETNEPISFNEHSTDKTGMMDFAKPVGKENGHEYRGVALGDLLTHANAPPIMQYFSLDIEGSEDAVMQTFPWDKYTFYSITVERPGPWLREELPKRGYIYMFDHGNFGDRFYLHKSFPSFDTWKARIDKVKFVESGFTNRQLPTQFDVKTLVD